MNTAAVDQGLALAPLLRRSGSVIESEIRGRSMGVTLPAGSRIQIRCGTEAELRPGMVVAFLGGQGLVGHRVVGTARDLRGRLALLTRGDGRLVTDPPVDLERVLGVVTARAAGQDWQPLPAAPEQGPGQRTIAAGLLLLIRLSLAVHPALAARVAVLLMRVADRVSAGRGEPRQAV